MTESRIISLNIDRRISEIVSLSQVITERRPTVVCIQDIFKRHNKDKRAIISTLFMGYTEHTDENLPMATLTDTQTVKMMKKQVYNIDNKIHMILLLIQQLDLHTETIANIYIRPQATEPSVIDALNWIENNTDNMSRLVLLGDCNASNPLWDATHHDRSIRATHLSKYETQKIRRGKIIEHWIRKWNLTCLNEDKKEPTYRAADGHLSTIDISLLGSKSARKWKHLEVDDKEEQGHRIICVRNITSKSNTSLTRTVLIPSLEKINSRMIDTIRVSLDERCTNWQQLARQEIIDRMNTIVNELCGQILRIQLEISRPMKLHRGTINKRSKTASAIRSKRTQNILDRFKRIERKKELTHQNSRKRALRHQTDKLCKKLVTSIIKIHTSAKPEQDIWKRLRIMRDELTKNQDSLTIVTKDKLEAIAKEKFPAIPRQLLDASDSSPKGTSIHMQETLRALNKLKTKSYTTPEGIRMQVFHRIVMQIPDIMHTIASMSFKSMTIPRKAEYTQGTIIPKKAQGQFRIVHVPSAIAAFLETIALARLDHRLEANRLLNRDQYGFTALRSRHDLLARTLELAYRYAESNDQQNDTFIVSMDIEGAFDNVNQELLITKLYAKLGDNSLTSWLRSFLANRKITIKHQHLRTQYRNVCQGVPQGSALGPVLWNFIIHDIERHAMRDSSKAHLLKYADDIYLIANCDNMMSLQRLVNSFVDAIGQLKLNVRPEKSSYMVLFKKPTVLSQNARCLLINKQPIKEVSTMNILGIHMTDSCKLDIHNRELIDKLAEAADVMHKLKRTRLIKSNLEWRMLVNSLILSRTTYNSWPLLLRNQKDQVWLHRLIIRTLKTAFGWPQNTSSKLIELILDIRKPATHIEKTVAEKWHLENGRTYEYLLGLDRGTLTRVNRRYVNPDKTIAIQQHFEHSEQISRREMWFMIEGKLYAGLVQLKSLTCTSEILSISWHHQSPYTNALAALTRATKLQTISGSTIVINAQSSLLQALLNWDNHDERIINLREAMHDASWNINTVNGELHERLKKYVKWHCKRLGLQRQLGDTSNNFSQWLMAMEQGDNQTRNNTGRQPVTAERYPPTYDFKLRLQAKKAFELTAQMDRRLCLTSTCKEIESNADKWRTINPTYLEGEHMLMLTGLVKGSYSKRIRKDSITRSCNYCKKVQQINEKALWHRAKECSKFEHTNASSLTKKIRYLTRIAFPKITYPTKQTTKCEMRQ